MVLFVLRFLCTASDNNKYEASSCATSEFTRPHSHSAIMGNKVQMIKITTYSVETVVQGVVIHRRYVNR